MGRLAALCFLLVVPAFAEDIFKLPIGDAARKDRDVPLVLDAITDTASVLTIDGVAVADRETLSRLMAAKRWGDTAGFAVQRDGASVPVTVLLRRELPSKPQAPAKP